MMPIPALEEKIKHLKDELTKEERIKTGVATMLKVAISAVQKKKVEEQLEGSNNKIASIKAQLVGFESALEIKQQAFEASAPPPSADSRDPKDAKERKKTLKRELTTIKATKKTLEKQIASSKEKNKTPKTDLVEQLDDVNEKMKKMTVELEELDRDKRDHIDIVTTSFLGLCGLKLNNSFFLSLFLLFVVCGLVFIIELAGKPPTFLKIRSLCCRGL